MSLDPIRSLGSIDPRLVYADQVANKPATSFADQLQAAVDGVQQMQTARNDEARAMIRGDGVGVDEVMTTAEEAELSFELMLEVRNKLLDSYQEIMRMQV